MKEAIRRLPNYVKRYGWADGVRLSFGIERKLPVQSAHRQTWRVPGLAAPVYLRDSVADHSIFWQSMVKEQYSIDRFPHALRLDDVYHAAHAAGTTPLIIDCGANFGLSVLCFAQRFPQARIVAVEPDTANFEMLRLNTAHLGERVLCVKAGVWPSSGWLRIRNPESGSAAFRVDECPADTPGAMRACTVDELCELGGARDPLIVKLDIEGSQAHLFKANTQWVTRAGLITLELDDWLMPWAGTSQSLFACIGQQPYEYLLGGESIFCFRDTARINATSVSV